jgi:hypothetical protein
MNVNIATVARWLGGGDAGCEVVDAVGDVVEGLVEGGGCVQAKGVRHGPVDSAQSGQFFVGVVADGHDQVRLACNLFQGARGNVRGCRLPVARGRWPTASVHCCGCTRTGRGLPYAQPRGRVHPGRRWRGGGNCGACRLRSAAGLPVRRPPVCAGGGRAGWPACPVRPAAPRARSRPGLAGPRCAGAPDRQGPRAWLPVPGICQLLQYSLIQF